MKEEELPSLYESVLNYEKISTEVRRNNQELKALKEIFQEELQDLSQTLNQSIEEMKEESFCEREQLNKALKNQKDCSEQALLEALDGIYQLKSAIKKMGTELIESIPDKLWFQKEFLAKKQAVQTIRSLSQGADMVFSKLIQQLRILDVEVIMPSKGDLFSPKKHRAIETCQGVIPNTIAEVCALGYLKYQEVIKYCDVKVYN